MKTNLLLKISLLLLMTAYGNMHVFAQVLPLVYDVENTGANCAKPPLPTIGNLTPYAMLPDPWAWANGSGRIKTFQDWECRRNEIKAQLENYEIGVKPPRPSNITASYSGGVLTVKVTENGKTLTLNSEIVVPSGPGPFPAIIGMNSPTGSLPASVFSSRNIAQITYHHDQVTVYNAKNASDPFFQLYPNLTANGQFSAWAWGVSRIIDGLELVQDQLPIDLKHIGVTGCSYAGKMALFSGAFDERVALTIPQESGGGGAAAWRVSETLGNVEKLGATNHQWFMQSMFQFAGANVPKLPHDHHELLGMVAPRALLVLGNYPDWVWLAEESCYVSERAAEDMYKTFGISDRFGFSHSSHTHCAFPNDQLTVLGNFVDKFLLGKADVNTSGVSRNPFPNTDYNKWISAWKGYVLDTIDPKAPLVSITSPATGSNYTMLDTVKIGVIASDSSGSISDVAFYADTLLLGRDSVAPYSIDWYGMNPGMHNLTAVATDSKGLITRSAIVRVNIQGVETPYNGVRHLIPGIIQAEEYDNGGEGLGFHEANTNGNEGGAMIRKDNQVDIEICTDTGGGYDIAYILQGEWLAYMVDVQETGPYEVDLRIATNSTGEALHIEMDSTNITGSVNLPNTGGWQNWRTVTVKNVNLTAGDHVMRIAFDASYMNLNYVAFRSQVVTGLTNNVSSQIEVYPNPFTEGIRIKNERSFQYRITDMSGFVLESGSGSDTQILGTGLKTGMYLLTIENQNGIFIQKIVRK